MDIYIYGLLYNKEDLRRSKWGNYFKNLYGEIPNEGYPIDISKFWLLYTDLLKKFRY